MKSSQICSRRYHEVSVTLSWEMFPASWMLLSPSCTGKLSWTTLSRNISTNMVKLSKSSLKAPQSTGSWFVVWKLYPASVCGQLQIVFLIRFQQLQRRSRWIWLHSGCHRWQEPVRRRARPADSGGGSERNCQGRQNRTSSSWRRVSFLRQCW